MIYPLINVSELKSIVSNTVLIDAGSGTASLERYKKQHLAGALYADLEADLSEIPENAANGGRHPLPAPKKFSGLLGRLGVSPHTHVVVYDDKSGTNAAARFWWMLRAAGHEKVQVLNGGLQAAISEEYIISNKPETATSAGPYPFKQWQLPTVDIAKVKAASTNDKWLIIDVRAEERYDGTTEPIDLKAGHIPSAINIPLSQNLDEMGYFQSLEILKEKYSAALKAYDPDKIIVHCGSGVTACHTLLAITTAGFCIPNLYVGSWSEWSRNY